MEIRKNYFDFYTPEEWRVILKDHVESGLSVASYCKEKRIPVATFYGWKRRLDPSSVTNFKDRRDKWIKTIEDWEKSGLSKLEYCKERDFPAEVLSLWQKRLNPPLPKRSAFEKWTEIIEDWKKSGLEKAAYCRKKKFGASHFYQWERRITASKDSFSSELEEESLTNPEVSLRDIFVKSAPSETLPPPDLKIEAILPQGHRLCLENSLDEGAFKKWVAPLLAIENENKSG